MATNTNYSVLVQSLVDDLTKWKDYIAYNTSTILQFVDTVDTLLTQIDNLEMEIEALKIKIDETSDYVRLSASSIIMNQSKMAVESTAGITNIQQASEILKSYTNMNEIYVYANKTVDGLYIDNKAVVSSSDASTVSGTKAFYKFNGSDLGITHNLLALNTKNMVNVKLMFSSDTNWDDVSAFVDRSDGRTKVLNLMIKPTVASKQVITPPSTLIEKTTGIQATQIYSNPTVNINKKTVKNATKLIK